MHALAKGKVDQETMVVRDGQEALDFLFYEGLYSDRAIYDPQVILLDLHLPKIDGEEVLKKIRSQESTKLIPVIILTTSKDEEVIARSYNEGANKFLTKPIKLEEFNMAIQQFLTCWVKSNKFD